MLNSFAVPDLAANGVAFVAFAAPTPPQLSAPAAPAPASAAPAPASATPAPASTPAAPVDAVPRVPGLPADAAPGVPGTLAPGGAQAAPGAVPPPAGAAPSGGFFMLLIWGMALVLVLTMFSSWRAQKRERAKREELLGSLRKMDRVQTIGGTIGTVIEIRDDEIVLQGETPSTKFRFARSAIQQVLRASDAAPAPGEPRDAVKA